MSHSPFLTNNCVTKIFVDMATIKFCLGFEKHYRKKIIKIVGGNLEKTEILGFGLTTTPSLNLNLN